MFVLVLEKWYTFHFKKAPTLVKEAMWTVVKFVLDMGAKFFKGRNKFYQQFNEQSTSSLNV